MFVCLLFYCIGDFMVLHLVVYFTVQSWMYLTIGLWFESLLA